MQPNQHENLQTLTSPVIIRHNFFTPVVFMWVWAKYVVGFNDRYHCTNCLRARYARLSFMAIVLFCAINQRNAPLAVGR